MDFVRDPVAHGHPGCTCDPFGRSNLTGASNKIPCLAILLVPFWGWLSDHLERLSDLQPRNQKVTLNHLVLVFSCSFPDDLRFVEG